MRAFPPTHKNEMLLGDKAPRTPQIRRTYGSTRESGKIPPAEGFDGTQTCKRAKARARDHFCGLSIMNNPASTTSSAPPSIARYLPADAGSRPSSTIQHFEKS